MRIIKPQRLAVLHRTFEMTGRFYFVPTVMVCFDIGEPDVPLHEVVMWIAATASLGPQGAMDEGMRKGRAEVLVAGNAHPVGGVAATACQVRLAVGPDDDPWIDKRLYVVGDRHWETTGPSKPEPFTAMSTNWSHAFGGEDYALNVAGKGLAPIERDDKTVHELPNVEDPKRLMKSKDDRPKPAGFGPLDLRHPDRRKHAGTYGQRWLDKHAPGLAEDFDFRCFNVAPEDQRLEREAFAGGERFVVENMHPDRPVIEGRMPTLVPRAWWTKTGDATRTLREIALRCDTLFVLPNQAMAVAMYRGVTEVTEDDAADIAELLVAAESPNEKKQAAHYDKALLNRLEGEMRALYGLQDADLLPPLPEGTDPMGLDRLPWPEELHHQHNAMVDNQKRKVEAERQKAVSEAEAAGHDPSALPGPLPTHDPHAPLDPEKLAEQVADAKEQAERAKREGEEKKAAMEVEARAQAEAAGVDYDKMQKQALAAMSGPPKFRAEDELARLDELAAVLRKNDAQIPSVEAHLASDKMRQRLLKVEAAQVAVYRMNAHLMPGALPLDDAASVAIRDRIHAGVKAGESFRDADFTGANLRGMDLSGANMAGAFFEGANLSGVIAKGADFSDAVLSRADLTDADLEGSRLVAANLGGAKLYRTRLASCEMTRAVLSEAHLEEAVLDGAVLDQAFVLGTVFQATSLRGIRAERVVFYDLDLSGLDCAGAQLTDCTILKTRLVKTNFAGARISGGAMIEVDASGACFDDVEGLKLRIVHQSRLPRATFRRARLVEANFRGTDLENADFEGASIEGGDLSEARLAGANFERVRAARVMAVRTDFRGASLYGADLREGVLQKAVLASADLSQTNLFRADLLRIHTDGKTKLEGARMKNMRFKERRDDAE